MVSVSTILPGVIFFPLLRFLFFLILELIFYMVAPQYEPELFPGLIYRMRQPKIVLLIFVSGKIVLTGAKVGSHFLWVSLLLDKNCAISELFYL
jgi:hypothetical protein